MPLKSTGNRNFKCHKTYGEVDNYCNVGPSCVQNFPRNVIVKDFWKWVYIWEIKIKSRVLFLDTVYNKLQVHDTHNYANVLRPTRFSWESKYNDVAL